MILIGKVASLEGERHLIVGARGTRESRWNAPALRLIATKGPDLAGNEAHRDRRTRMREWIAVLKAADAAGRWHTHQRRKGAAFLRRDSVLRSHEDASSISGNAGNGRRSIFGQCDSTRVLLFAALGQRPSLHFPEFRRTLEDLSN
jgi:hypothetical protein